MSPPQQGQYVYCITAGVPRALPESLRGIDSLPVSLLRCQDLAAVVSGVDASGEIPLTRERGIAHMRVIENFTAVTPVLPLAFGMVAPSAFAVERELLAAYAEELRRMFQRLGTSVEIDLVVQWKDVQEVFQAIARSPELQRFKGRGSAGTVSRQQAIEIGQWVKRRLEEQRATEEAAVVAPLMEYVAERVDLPRFGDSMVCRVAFLVSKANLPAFEAEVERQGQRGESRLRLKLVGPTPPFHFAQLPISFAAAHAPH